MGDKIVGN